MSIELLWLIPVVALALFLPVLILSIQRSTNQTVNSQTRDLAREVEQFNNGLGQQPLTRTSNQNRGGEIEKTINLVTAALSSQQEIIAAYKGKDTSYEYELNELKEKLLHLQQEYDIVISENYSLRARIKKLRDESPERDPDDQQPSSVAGVYTVQKGGEETDKPLMTRPVRIANMALYDDTRMFKASDLDDTSEIRFSDLR